MLKLLSDLHLAAAATAGAPTTAVAPTMGATAGAAVAVLLQQPQN